jgi:hypothetical protein
MGNSPFGEKAVSAFWLAVIIIIGTAAVRTVVFLHDVLSSLAVIR